MDVGMQAFLKLVARYRGKPAEDWLVTANFILSMLLCLWIPSSPAALLAGS